jgi:hypothetical protein
MSVDDVFLASLSIDLVVGRRRSRVCVNQCLSPSDVFCMDLVSLRACFWLQFFRNCCCCSGRPHSGFFPAKSADAPPVPIFRWPVDDLNSIFVIRVQLRVLCPKSRAVRVLFSCPQTRAGNFCPVSANEMNPHYLVYLSFVGAAFRVH